MSSHECVTAPLPNYIICGSRGIKTGFPAHLWEVARHARPASFVKIFVKISITRGFYGASFVVTAVMPLAGGGEIHNCRRIIYQVSLQGFYHGKRHHSQLWVRRTPFATGVPSYIAAPVDTYEPLAKIHFREEFSLGEGDRGVRGRPFLS